MVDLWTGLFAALVGGAIGVVASVIGARMTGRFMLAQQERDSRRRADQAVRALLVELANNRVLIRDLMNPAARAIAPYPPALGHFVWETQRPLLTDLGLDTLGLVAEAYRGMDVVLAQCSRNARGFWELPEQNQPLVDATSAVDQAMAAVRLAAGLPEQPPS